MPITLHPNELRIKDPSTGEYSGMNVLAELKTEEYFQKIEDKGEDTIESIPSDYADQPIVIDGNTVCGAIETDYFYGLNVMENAVYLKGYAGIVIENNSFSNGISDVIDLEICRKVLLLKEIK